MAEVVSIITLIHRISSVIPYYVTGSTVWILATGLWNDSGIWSDTDVWID